MRRSPYTVAVLEPAGYAHARAFAEVAEGIDCSLRALGYRSRLELVRGASFLEADRTHIVLGANVVAHEEGELRVPANTIVYNLEQIVCGSVWLTPRYVEMLTAHRVWDYSRRNIAAAAELGVRDAVHVPVGFTPELERIQRVDEDIDVLFYGSLSPRRARVLEALAARGLTVVRAFGVYGDERDALIARSRCVLNLHACDQWRVFEIVRCSYLLTNRKCVVSERGDDAAEEAPFAEGVAFCDYDTLVDTCVAYATDGPRRRALAARGYEIFRGMPQVDFVAAALR